MRSTRILVLLLCVLVLGCSRGPTPVRAPNVKPAEAAASALDAYDSDGNGQLDKDELEACPGLLDGFAGFDKNKDEAIDSEEIAGRLTNLYGNGVGMLSLGCRVTSRGRPVPDCIVRLIPESFLGEAVKPAEGTTRESGTAMLCIAADDLPAGLENVRGVHSGIYRAEISHESPSITKLIEKSGPFGFDVSVGDQVSGLTIELSR